MIDRGGRVAVHTGARCIRHAGHAVGDQVSAQANIMERDTVPAAMVRAYSAASGAGFAERLLAALAAAEGEGGDLRGRQSAALVVVSPRATGNPAEDKPIDLRVEDHPDPVAELRRLVSLRRAYEHVDVGDQLAAAGDVEGSLGEYEAAHRSQPDNHELAFWHGVALAASGREEDAAPILRQRLRGARRLDRAAQAAARRRAVPRRRRADRPPDRHARRVRARVSAPAGRPLADVSRPRAHLRAGRRRRERRGLLPARGPRAKGRSRRRRRRPRRRDRDRGRPVAARSLRLPARRALQGAARRSRAGGEQARRHTGAARGARAPRHRDRGPRVGRPLGPRRSRPARAGGPRRRRRARQQAVRHPHAPEPALRRARPPRRGAHARTPAAADGGRGPRGAPERGQVVAARAADPRPAEGGGLSRSPPSSPCSARSSGTTASWWWRTSPA